TDPVAVPVTLTDPVAVPVTLTDPVAVPVPVTLAVPVAVVRLLGLRRDLQDRQPVGRRFPG
ncbi:hypothetical protein, partial [Microbispora hainanensis]|uniref:hypothetical protein n=1 Tax=Microbispora hainanensis TaxID=568844 RepID=UPI00340F8EAF